MDFIHQEDIVTLKRWLASASYPVIVAHTHPDGDALGASSGLALYLRGMGKDVAVILPDTPPDNLRFILPKGIPFLFHDEDPAGAEARIARADLIILADANAFTRTSTLEPFLKASAARKVLMDHHLNPDTQSFGLVFSTPDISSASEVVYWLLKALTENEIEIEKEIEKETEKTEKTEKKTEKEIEIEKEIEKETEGMCAGEPKAPVPPGASACFLAPGGTGPSAMREGPLAMCKGSSEMWAGGIGAALMTGMTTDTNNFANSVFPSTFQMASELIAAGVDRDALIGKIYQSYRENRVRLMGYMQSEELHILDNGTAYMVLTRDIQERFDMRDGESEGLVNVPLTIEKVRLSVLLKEDDGHFRVSVRSKKGTSAQQLAQRFFHGGGHENAAGGKMLIGEDIPSADAAPACLEQVLKDYLK